MQDTQTLPFDFDTKAVLEYFRKELGQKSDFKRVNQTDEFYVYEHRDYPVRLSLSNDKATKRVKRSLLVLA